ncbi:hypothetical protein V1512DRAFT_247790 [Lipomyces arxii]|uniref:uncharacterized protein n=1 Tax=Lipomyces arxii TaxID=56418 RepID=UPI0034CD9F02
MQFFFRRYTSQKDASQGPIGQPVISKVELPKYTVDEVWNRSSVSIEIGDRFIVHATAEIKRRGVLEPFVLLPWRPDYNLLETKSLVHRMFAGDFGLEDADIVREVKFSDVLVLVSVLKWVWARIPGGVVSWDVYDLFKAGEEDLKMSEVAFKTLIPLVSESTARSRIIFNFFDVLSSITSHWKMTSMSGIKVAKLACWWAFSLSDELKKREDETVKPSNYGPSEYLSHRATFSEAYKLWMRAAEASSHLYFAYLRSEAASIQISVTTLSALPAALSSLLASTPYPPRLTSSDVTESLFLSSFVSEPSNNVLATLQHFYGLARRNGSVSSVSIDDEVVNAFLYADPTERAYDTYLTPESSRLLCDIGDNLRQFDCNRTVSGAHMNASITENVGFDQYYRTDPKYVNDYDRPRTRTVSGSSVWSTNRTIEPESPVTANAWSEFATHGFYSDSNIPKIMDPEKYIPDIAILTAQPRNKQFGLRTNQSAYLEPLSAELGALQSAKVPLDYSFWWTWLCAYGPEETPFRRSIFCSCLLIEFDASAMGLSHGMTNSDRFVIIEERMIKAVHQVVRSRDRSFYRHYNGVQHIRRLASRNFKFRTRPESSVVAAAAGMKLKERASLLSLYREFQSNMTNNGSMTVSMVDHSDPGDDRVRRLYDVVNSSTIKSSESDSSKPNLSEAYSEAASYDNISWMPNAPLNQSLQQEFQQLRVSRRLKAVSVVLEDKETIAKALQWAADDSLVSTVTENTPGNVDQLLPTPAPSGLELNDDYAQDTTITPNSVQKQVVPVKISPVAHIVAENGSQRKLQKVFKLKDELAATSVALDSVQTKPALTKTEVKSEKFKSLGFRKALANFFGHSSRKRNKALAVNTEESTLRMLEVTKGDDIRFDTPVQSEQPMQPAEVFAEMSKGMDAEPSGSITATTSSDHEQEVFNANEVKAGSVENFVGAQSYAETSAEVMQERRGNDFEAEYGALSTDSEPANIEIQLISPVTISESRLNQENERQESKRFPQKDNSGEARFPFLKRKPIPAMGRRSQVVKMPLGNSQAVIGGVISAAGSSMDASAKEGTDSRTSQVNSHAASPEKDAPMSITRRSLRSVSVEQMEPLKPSMPPINSFNAAENSISHEGIEVKPEASHKNRSIQMVYQGQKSFGSNELHTDLSFAGRHPSVFGERESSTNLLIDFKPTPVGHEVSNTRPVPRTSFERHSVRSDVQARFMNRSSDITVDDTQFFLPARQAVNEAESSKHLSGDSTMKHVPFDHRVSAPDELHSRPDFVLLNSQNQVTPEKSPRLSKSNFI